MKIRSHFLYFVSALLFAPGLTVSLAQAADYPTKPVRFIIPAAPGGTTDGLGRIFAARMSEVLGQQVVADNRPSASGVLAAEVTKSAAPDGHTIFLAYRQHTVNAALIKKLPYHPVNDFTRIRAVGGTPVGSSPEDFRKFLLADMAKWADVVKRSGAKLD